MAQSKENVYFCLSGSKIKLCKYFAKYMDYGYLSSILDSEQSEEAIDLTNICFFFFFL